MNQQTLNAAVVGFGIGTQHALAFLENPHCHLSRIVDFDEEKARDFAKTYALPETSISTLDAVLKDKDIHLISLASFDDDHYEQVISALKENKHVFVEKPLCQTRKQLQHIYQEWKNRECALASNLVLRTAELYQFIKALIEQGDLGEIYAFDGDYLYGRLHKITEGWRKDVENYSVMEGGGIHIIDLMLWLTGQKPISVFSQSNKIVTKNTDFRYHDFHSAIFSFESGLLGRITANFGCVHPHQHVIRIFGTKGTFIYDDLGPRIHWKREEQTQGQNQSQAEILHKAPKPPKKGELIHEWVNKIRQKDFRAMAQREFDLMSVVLTADEALHCEGPLKIEYL